MLGDHYVLIGLVLLLALVIFGPKRLPELGHSVGQAITEFKRGTQSVADEVRSVTSPTMAAPGESARDGSGDVASGLPPGPGRSDQAG